MSNYPVGVTGREPQIAGMAEQRTYVECRSTSERPVMAYDDRCALNLAVDRLEAALIGWIPGEEVDQDDTVGRWAYEIVNRWSSMKTSEVLVEMDCEFTGEVDAQVDDEYAYADCPRCGKEIEFEHGLFEPDPDADRDE